MFHQPCAPVCGQLPAASPEPGHTDPVEFDEGNPYGVSKVTGQNTELVDSDLAALDLDWVIFRPGVVVGPSAVEAPPPLASRRTSCGVGFAGRASRCRRSPTRSSQAPP